MSGAGYFSRSTGMSKNGGESPNSPAASAGTMRNTALSNKLTSVLSASYADSEVRDALGLLDIRGVENNAETRRRLRLDAQKEVIDCNAAVVQDFGKVADQLKRIGTMIKTLNQTCHEMRQHITTAKQETSPILEEASTLLVQKEEVEMKQQLLAGFNKHFVLSDAEIASLTNATEPVNDAFFEALTRAKRIHSDCEVLLENENQRLGLELMEQTSRQINSAYKKLYNWVQKEFKTLDLEDPHINGTVRKALRVLAERPSLFQSCLDYFAEAREHNLSHAFHAALTDPNAMSSVVPDAKPIEFSTHDTLRYVGDMLAWVHSAAVSEREALEGLFVGQGEELAKGVEVGQHTEPWSRVNQVGPEDGEEASTDQAFDPLAALASLISRNLSGVTRTLKQRVEFAIRGNDDPITVYKTMNLVTFYLGIFAKLVGSESPLSEAINDLQSFAFSHFERLLSDEATEVSNEATLSNDLSAPHFLLNALDRLSVLLRAQSASTYTPNASTSSPTSLTRLLSVALTPFLDICSELAASLPDPEKPAVDSTPDPSSVVFQLNYMSPVRSTLSPYLSDLDSTSSSSLPSTLDARITSLSNTLTILQHSFLLHASYVQPLLSTLPSSPDIPALSLPPIFQPPTLATLASELDGFLPSAHMDALENLRSLTDKSLARRCTEEAIDRFVEDFESVVIWMEEWDRVHGVEVREEDTMSMVSGVTRGGRAEKEGTIGLRRAYPRRVEEVRVLLS